MSDSNGNGRPPGRDAQRPLGRTIPEPVATPLAPRPHVRGNPNMIKGGPSINPHGRKPIGTSLAEAVRRKVPPDRIVDEALRRLDDPEESGAVKMAAIVFLAERGYGKVTTTIDANVMGAAATHRDWSKMPVGERMALLEQLRSVPVMDSDAIDVGDEPTDDSGTE